MKPVLFVLLMVLAETAGAQDTLKTGFEVVANFPAARSLEIDSDGLIYVVSASEVVQLDYFGSVKAHLDGTNTGVFGDLADVDIGNGLIWVVADAGNGSLVRFSKELLHLETIRLPRNKETEVGRSPRLDMRDGSTTALGQPIAVVTVATGSLFAVDATSQTVLKWDSSRRLERVIGEFGTGAGELLEPVSIAAGASALYVADRTLGMIKVYDHYGGHIRNLRIGSGLSSILVAGTELWAVFSQAIWIYTHRGQLSRQIVVVFDEPLIAAAPVQNYIMLLTPTQLLRVLVQPDGYSME